jgi:hypothetical protein
MFGYNPAQTVYFIEFPKNDPIPNNSNKFIKIHQNIEAKFRYLVSQGNSKNDVQSAEEYSRLLIP